MENLNRIELRGNVGNVRFPVSGNNKFAIISLATNTYLPNKDNPGTATIETVWHSIVAFYNDKMPNFEDLKKGATLGVVGRVRLRPYTLPNGELREQYEVVASSIEIIQEK